MIKREAIKANQLFIDFLQKYVEVLTKQIEEVQLQTDASVASVMAAVQELSTSTEEKKREADQVLEQTYLTPDETTLQLATSIQQSTDDIFEQATREVSGNVSMRKEDVGLDKRRMGGLFSKHMESMSTLDDSLRDTLLSIVGTMSNSDVTKQRLDHIIMSLKAMHVGLSNILVDLDRRLNTGGVKDFKENLLDYTYQIYSTSQERDTFKTIFGAPPALQSSFEETKAEKKSA